MISLLAPTRNRRQGLAEMWQSAQATATDPDDLELVIYTDDGDDAYQGLQLVGSIVQITGPRIVLSEMWNECAAKAHGDILWHGADDIRFRTPAWDLAVLNAFERHPDGIVLAHGRDGVHDAELATHGFISRRWYETIGYFVPPYFVSDYNDSWLTDVADRIDRRVFLPGVYTEHMHPVVGKGPWDSTHQERMARHAQHDPGALYNTLAGEREVWAEKLRAVMIT